MFIAALAVSLSLMAETTTTPAAAPPVGQAVAAAPDKPKLICRKVTPLGSRMPKKVCQTPEQIAQERSDAKDMVRDMQRINPEQAH